MTKTHRLLLSAIVGLGVAASPGQAQTVIEEWNTAKFPPPPTLKGVNAIVPVVTLTRFEMIGF